MSCSCDRYFHTHTNVATCTVKYSKDWSNALFFCDAKKFWHVYFRKLLCVLTSDYWRIQVNMKSFNSFYWYKNYTSNHEYLFYVLCPGVHDSKVIYSNIHKESIMSTRAWAFCLSFGSGQRFFCPMSWSGVKY